jgi:hypothetical protein
MKNDKWKIENEKLNLISEMGKWLIWILDFRFQVSDFQFQISDFHFPLAIFHLSLPLAGDLFNDK